MIVVAAEVAIGLRVVSVLGGLAGGVAAVYLARVIPPRMGVEVRPRSNLWWGVAIAVGAAFGWFAAPVGWSLIPAWLVFGGATLGLTLIDLDHQLLPNRVLFPAMAVAAPLLAGGALVEGRGPDLPTALLAGVAYFAFLLIVALIARGGFGMGDVKLALLLGIFLGFLGWDVLSVGIVLAILLGGVASVLVLLLTGKGKESKFAYGPYLVAGAWIGLFWGSQIADWYLGRS
jgi:leader peptidase (prepilin peptidase) / N-methyltransferase